ncbi:MAG: tRNA (guanosine(46)-N7)-methyltransferase TrmB [Cytophagaceae bacterium]
MSRKKLVRFESNAANRNVIEDGKEIYRTIKGNWRSFFGNENPIVLEVGCGRGEYTTGLATLYPHKNFIGTDIKGSRIWKGSTVAVKNEMLHVAFLRTMIQNLEEFFEEDELDEIWITFPDPRPKDIEERLRLTNERFMNMYKKLLKKGGKLNFKTDNAELFQYTLDLIQTKFKIRDLQYTNDVYNSALLNEELQIQTTYEKKFRAQGVKINYMSFYFD